MLDYEAGLYDDARERLQQAVRRDGDDGLCCYYLGICSLELGDATQALDWGYKATRCIGTVSLGHDLVGRARMKLGAIPAAVTSFENAVRANRNDTVAADHLLLALYRRRSPNGGAAIGRAADCP